MSTGVVDPWLLEAKAFLHAQLQQVSYICHIVLLCYLCLSLWLLLSDLLLGGQYDKALGCYLEIEPSDSRETPQQEEGEEEEDADDIHFGKKRNFQYVFDLIEKQVHSIFPSMKTLTTFLTLVFRISSMLLEIRF
jgi:hypothetical protein